MKDKSIWRDLLVNIMGGLIGGVVLIFIGFYAYRWLDARSQLTPTPAVATLALAPTPTPKPLTGTSVPLTPTHTGTPTPTPPPGRNIALGKPAAASTWYGIHTPDKANDGDTGTWWTSDFPPQWWKVELEGTFTVTGLELVVQQSVAGRRVDKVEVFVDSEWISVYIFDGDTRAGDVRSWSPEQPIDVSQVRITTTETPNTWVSWAEVRVYGSSP